MTLIELMAASALAALLMTAMFGLLRAMSVQRNTLFKNRVIEPWRDQLVEQLRWDFSNARQMSVTPEELHLVGYGGCDFATKAATLRPTEIIYSIKVDGRHHWLLRKESHLDSNSLNNSHTEIAAPGIAAIVVQRIDDSQNDEQLDRTQTTERKHSALRALTPVSNKLRIVLFGEDENTHVLDEQILLF
jgi:hypothetical protein